MKKILATLALYIYNEYIYEDWDLFTKWGKIFIYPFWLIRVVYVIVASPVLALGYYWEKSEMNTIVQEARLESMVMMDQIFNDFNKK